MKIFTYYKGYMIKKKSDINIISFSQKVLDKESLINFTPNFILEIYFLFYRSKYGKSVDPKLLRSESEFIMQLIKTALFTEIEGYKDNIKKDSENILQITFEKDHPDPIVSLYNQKDQTDVLIDVLFKKISWDEVNEFRKFLVDYLEYFLNKFHSNRFSSKEDSSKRANNITYVIQELLQNANEHGEGENDYELLLKFDNNKFFITVINYALKEKANQLISIVDDIRNNENHDDLLLKYMLEEDKHLGIISSIVNFNVDEYGVKYKDEVVKVDFQMNI